MGKKENRETKIAVQSYKPSIISGAMKFWDQSLDGRATGKLDMFYLT